MMNKRTKESTDIIEEISKKETDKYILAGEVINTPEYVPAIIDGLFQTKGNIKFGCCKIVRIVSEKRPELLYPFFDTFSGLLKSDNNIIKWDAIIVISNLATVDTENKFPEIFEEYYAPVTGKAMITAANIIGSSWKMALARPELTERIVNEILKVEYAIYETKGRISPECNNIVCGYALDSLEKIYNTIKEKKRVEAFIKRQLNNNRNSVVKKAERFLKIHGIK